MISAVIAGERQKETGKLNEILLWKFQRGAEMLPSFFFSLSPGGVFLVPGKAECRDGFPFPLLNEGTVGSQIIFLDLSP